MTSNTSTADEAYFRPSGSWWTGDDAPDFEDMQQEELEFMQDQEAERMEDNLPSAPPLPERDVMEDTAIESTVNRVMQVTVIEPRIDVKNPALNTYAMVKARHEKTCVKIESPSQFVLMKMGEIIYFKQTALVQHFSNVFYYEPSKKEGEPHIKHLFIKTWLQDEDMKTCLKVVIDPTLPPGAALNLNLWSGFAAAKLPPVPDADVAALVEPIIHLFTNVYTHQNMEHVHYFTSWHANHIQRPHLPSGVALLLYGVEGCGKGVFATFHRRVVGQANSFHTQDLEKEIFSTHAEGLVNKVFIQADEVNIHSHERRESLKNIITNETITFEPKFAPRMTVKNMTNLFMTTNNENAISVSPTCRRFALFKCSPVYKGNIEYFKGLAKHLARPEVERAWYQYLMNWDLSKYESIVDFQELRPRTEYLKEVQQATIPCVSRFLSALINSQDLDASNDPSILHQIRDKVLDISAKLIYQKFQEFLTAGNYKIPQTQTSFGRNIKRINGVVRRKNRVGFHYTLDLVCMKKCLIENNEYDEDAFIDV